MKLKATQEVDVDINVFIFLTTLKENARTI